MRQTFWSNSTRVRDGNRNIQGDICLYILNTRRVPSTYSVCQYYARHILVSKVDVPSANEGTSGRIDSDRSIDRNGGGDRYRRGRREKEGGIVLAAR